MTKNDVLAIEFLDALGEANDMFCVASAQWYQKINLESRNTFSIRKWRKPMRNKKIGRLGRLDLIWWVSPQTNRMTLQCRIDFYWDSVGKLWQIFFIFTLHAPSYIECEIDLPIFLEQQAINCPDSKTFFKTIRDLTLKSVQHMENTNLENPLVNSPYKDLYPQFLKACLLPEKAMRNELELVWKSAKSIKETLSA